MMAAKGWRLLPAEDRAEGFWVEVIHQDGHVTTSVPPSWLKSIDAAIRWLQSEMDAWAAARPDWASYDTREIRLTWIPPTRGGQATTVTERN